MSTFFRSSLLMIVIIGSILPLANCKQKWIRGEGTAKEYMLHDETSQVAFDDAFSLCQSKESRLPQVMNGLENKAVKGMVPSSRKNVNYIWLGAYRRVADIFAWISGEKLSFVNWNDGKINESGKDDGIDLRGDNGKWETDSYPARKYVVCERDVEKEKSVMERLNEIAKQMALNQQATDKKLRLIEGLFDKQGLRIKKLKEKNSFYFVEL